ncbi:MAG TPA: DUF1998 domain-containing protein, partial [Bacilli bacterium]|nr:DUF1998 domain-containing protein [Bacilli bacterium]
FTIKLLQLRKQLKIIFFAFVKTISLVNTIKIVKTLIGFSRINPVEKGGFGFVDIKGENLWYPAYEIKGEGIFLELDENAINNWIHNNPEIKKRVDIMKSNSEKSLLGRTKSSILTPKFVLLHTLSHLLIKQLSFECGYSIASLSERLYWSKETDKNQMAGIFIYTTSGDSEGSLGGLVRQGRTDIFPQIFNNAILSAKTCSNDPICILSRGQGRDSLNLASCYACSLLPETCCEMSNSFLDRALVVGTYKADNIGFYSEIAKRHFKNTALL